MHHFSSCWQAVGGDHHIHQRLNLDVFQNHRPISQLAVVIQQLLNQLLQITAAGIQDLDNLFLFGVNGPATRPPAAPSLRACWRAAFSAHGRYGAKLMTL
jgi:hypothetical protein